MISIANSEDITLQEVPGEISVSFMVSGCPIRCKGCHSKKFWSTKKSKFIAPLEFANIISKYRNIATCVLFLGGEWCKDFDLYVFIAKEMGFKTCLYTGFELKEFKKKYKNVLELLDYIKVGKYVKELGALDSKTTNQRFYQIKRGWLFTKYKDLTHKFIKRDI